MIPVLIDGVKKYLLTEEEVDAKISASSGGSSSETLKPLFISTSSTFPTDAKYIGTRVLHVSQTSGSSGLVSLYAGQENNGETLWIETERWECRLM